VEAIASAFVPVHGEPRSHLQDSINGLLPDADSLEDSQSQRLRGCILQATTARTSA
jgi:hypothetical protein